MLHPLIPSLVRVVAIIVGGWHLVVGLEDFSYHRGPGISFNIVFGAFILLITLPSIWDKFWAGYVEASSSESGSVPSVREEL